MMVEEQPHPHDDPAPPLADLSTRPSPVPGPLTKPAPVIRPPKKRRRWVVLAAVLVVLAGLIAGGIAWSNSLQTAPQSSQSNIA
ncbi:hypothetical protein [Microbacterium profundi]|uniref:Uncharacterized protein n=1 Tax=Microbacterium profundi TaxID=450380 RepID=A0ABV3LDC6_9MICO|nr:hypothetical protein [Microbacterium profundi]MCE7482637.1 hypothetical protein [Microbacterium profundi]